ncbi:MAG: SRPBCC family protein [Dehalococcoidia bacterium]
MPEVEHMEIVKAPLPTSWEFCRDMNNWVQFLKGYQKHEEKNEWDSVWWIKGDVGILARTVSFEVHIDEWIEQESVTFSMKGISESMTGKGALRMEAADNNTTKLTFYLEVKAGGLIGPMVNAVLGPVLKPIADDFAAKLKARLEEIASQS